MAIPHSHFTRAVNHFHVLNSTFDGTLNHLHHFDLAADNNDTFHFGQVFKQPDCAEFMKAMAKEIKDHENNNPWHLFPCSQVPSDANVIQSIWLFKRRRLPDGTILIYKARL